MMNKRDIEQLTDELIGEAVLLLLRRKVPVNSMALLSQLRAMQEAEIDARRRSVFPTIIAYIEALMVGEGKPRRETESTEQTDLVKMLSGVGQQPGKGKIH
ncbi:hypothetical protein EGM70_11880 [Enterobacteriaceae bacterium 89]|nr:hypothetical protein [Enterobacteriaceae bacterium 89]